MLARVLEPEVMDTPEEARDYDAMDHNKVNRVFVGDFLAAWEGRGPILDLGTGTAQIPIEFCKRYPQTPVVAIDLAGHMLELARVNIARAGFHGRIRLELCDAKQLPFAEASFGAVMSNSIVHHIPEPRRVLAEAIRVTAPAGLIFFRDLLRPGDEETLYELVNRYAGDGNDHQRQMFADSLRAALSLEEIRALIRELGYDPVSVQKTSDRHWTWVARKT